MKAILSVIILPLFLLLMQLSSCKSKNNPAFVNSKMDINQSPSKVILSELSARIKFFHNEAIETEGIFYYEFENVAICTPKGIFTESQTCFWLDWNEELFMLPTNNSLEEDIDLSKFSDRKIRIKGIVDTTSKGHLGAYVATIKDLYYFEAL